MTAPAAELEEETWQDWPLERKLRLRVMLRRRRRHRQLRPDQLMPTGDWQKVLLTGGRGSGKSRAGADGFAEEILTDPERTKGAWAIVAPTFADARDKCVESEESGILVALGTSLREVEAKTSPVVSKWNRSIGELVLHDGTRIVIDGADDGAYRIQGENLRGVWADEVGLWKRWKTAWDESITFALRLGRSRIIATGTPKRSLPARKLIKRLIAEARTNPTVIHRRLKTKDNWRNLSAAFKAAVQVFVGTQLGAQELEGIMLEDAEGALWKREWIESMRTEELPYGGWQRGPRMGVDPSDGSDDGAEHAFTVAAQGMDHELYVVEQQAFRCTPYQFARECVLAADRHGAIIVLEKNHGGLWMVEVFDRVISDLGVHVAIDIVHASQSKRTRAEPVAALYEPRHMPSGEVRPGRVHHLGYFEELEDQMTNWTGAPGEVSPDRLDSLVWALWEWIDAGFRVPRSEHEQAVPFDDSVRSENAAELGAVQWR